MYVCRFISNVITLAALPLLFEVSFSQHCHACQDESNQDTGVDRAKQVGDNILVS